MASQAQLDANRRNAQKSTGPTTSAGKSKAAMNSLKHGLLAKEPSFVGEDLAAFKTFLEAVIDDQKPQGAVQLMLVHRIAHLQWKLGRVPAVEAQVVATAAAKETARRNAGREYERRPKPPVPGPETAEVIAMDPKRFDSLQIYEQRLERSLRACLKELRELRKEARTNEANLEEVEIEVSPSSTIAGDGPGDEVTAGESQPKTPREEANKRTQSVSNDRPEEELDGSQLVSATSIGATESSPELLPVCREKEKERVAS